MGSSLGVALMTPGVRRLKGAPTKDRFSFVVRASDDDTLIVPSLRRAIQVRTRSTKKKKKKETLEGGADGEIDCRIGRDYDLIKCHWRSEFPLRRRRLFVQERLPSASRPESPNLRLRPAVSALW